MASQHTYWKIKRKMCVIHLDIQNGRMYSLFGTCVHRALMQQHSCAFPYRPLFILDIAWRRRLIEADYQALSIGVSSGFMEREETLGALAESLACLYFVTQMIPFSRKRLRPTEMTSKKLTTKSSQRLLWQIAPLNRLLG